MQASAQISALLFGWNGIHTREAVLYMQLRHRILIADDHDAVRRSLKALLGHIPQCEVIAEATNGQEAVERAQETHPDVVLMDLSMPLMNGIEAARQIRRHVPQTKVLIVSQYDVPGMVQEAFDAGVLGYILKVDVGKDLVAALEAARNDETYLSVSLWHVNQPRNTN
jgi:two-component system, NarL family, nitrate/nitrite response regulator NarL